jgi:predicted PurR-regulated permease PerM
LTTQSTSGKYWKPLLLSAALILVAWLAFISMPVLLPFLVGILLAYLLIPLVHRLEKVLPPRNKAKKTRRVFAVIIVFIVFTIVLVAFMVYIGAALVTASTILIGKAPDFIARSIEQLKEWWSVFKVNLPADIDAQVSSTISGAAPTAAKFLQDFLVGSMAVVPASMPTVIGFITLPFFLIFVLIDYEVFDKYYNDIFPTRAARRTEDILKIFGDHMGRYVRFQIIMALIAGFLMTAGLAIIGDIYAPAMGIVTGFTQVIPIIGPFISAAIILIVTLAMKPDMVLWVILIIVIVQLVVNVVQGFVQEKHFPLHPAIVMVLMTVGGYIASYWGIILALPVGGTIWAIYKYFRNEQKAGAVTEGESASGRA